MNKYLDLMALALFVLFTLLLVFGAIRYGLWIDAAVMGGAVR